MSVLKSPVLLSNFSASEYAAIEMGFSSTTNHIEILHKYIRKKIIPYIDTKSFLDVGAGPGFVTRALLSHFNEIVALDPNNFYRPYYSSLHSLNNLKFINKNFEFANFNQQFNFILCSHVLYHIPQNYWLAFVKKMLNLLSKKGKALITLVSTRGKFHDLCTEINCKYSNSQTLKSILEKSGIDYEVSKMKSCYFSEDLQELTSLLRMFVIDDCFLPQQYASLPEKEIIAIDQRIVQFLDNCYDQKKGLYTFEINEDYIELQLS